MVELAFAIEGASIEPYAAEPIILFKLRITSDASAIAVKNVLLSCQVRIDAFRRRYTAQEQERLSELFGEPHRFEDTLHSMLWTHTSVQAGAFTSECAVDLPIACSFDFNVAATKYFYGLESGEVPLSFLFSGTVFYPDDEGFLQMDPIPWSKEASYRLPVRLWQEAIELHYPRSAWLRIGRDVFDEIYRQKRRHGFTSWEQTLLALLKSQREESVS